MNNSTWKGKILRVSEEHHFVSNERKTRPVKIYHRVDSQWKITHREDSPKEEGSLPFGQFSLQIRQEVNGEEYSFSQIFAPFSSSSRLEFWAHRPLGFALSKGGIIKVDDLSQLTSGQ